MSASHVIVLWLPVCAYVALSAMLGTPEEQHRRHIQIWRGRDSCQTGTSVCTERKITTSEATDKKRQENGGRWSDDDI